MYRWSWEGARPNSVKRSRAAARADAASIVARYVRFGRGGMVAE